MNTDAKHYTKARALHEIVQVRIAGAQGRRMYAPGLSHKDDAVREATMKIMSERK